MTQNFEPETRQERKKMGTKWEDLFAIVDRGSKFLSIVSGLVITFVMFLTVADVLLRAAGCPIVGIYDIVGLAGAIVIGLGLARTSWIRYHVYMEFLINRLSRRNRNIVNTATRISAIFLFVVIGVNLLRVGYGFQKTGEVSNTLRLVIYPFAHIFGVCCFILCLLFVFEIMKLWWEKNE